MEAFVKRVLDEQKELRIKLEGLTKFLNTGRFYELEIIQQELLLRQQKAMIDYDLILRLRLESLDTKE